MFWVQFPGNTHTDVTHTDPHLGGGDGRFSGGFLDQGVETGRFRTISWALRLRVASSASFCARDAHKCFVPLCIWMLSYHNTFAQ